MIYNKDQAEKLRILAQRKRIFSDKEADNFESLLSKTKFERNNKAVFILARNLFIISCTVLIAVFFVQNYKKYNTVIGLLNIEKENQRAKSALLTKKITGLENQLSKSISYNQDLAKQVEDLGLLKNEFKDRQDAAKQELELVMQSKIKDLQAKINQLESNFKQVSLNIQNNSSQRKAQLNDEGKILFINQEQEFVVINLGASSGINRDSRLGVIRDGKIIAELKAIEVCQDISACDIIKGQVNNLNIGDKINPVKE